MKKNILLIILTLFRFTVFSQTEINYDAQTDINTLLETPPSEVTTFKDSTLSLSFSEIQLKKFDTINNSINDYKASFWFRFTQKKTIKSKFFTLFFNNDDVVSVYLPTKQGYKKYHIGFFVKGEPIKKTLLEKLALTIKTDSVDFSKPFYYSKLMLTSQGKKHINSLPILLFSNHQFVIQGYLTEDSNTYKIIYFTVIFLFSFLLFFTNYIITKNINYRNYSFYIFFIIIIFGMRIPIIYNTLNKIHPHLFFYLVDLSQIISSGFYFYFIVVFLDFKTYFPKLYTFSVYLLKSFIALSLLIVALNLLFPHSTFRFIVFDTYRVIFTLISLCVFFYLMTKKLDRITTIVLIGSFLLIIGNFLTLFLSDFSIFLATAVIEIILFSGVISYKNKLILKQSNDAILAIEFEKTKRIYAEKESQFKSSFLANITHEFRTPLTLIFGPIQKQLKRNNINEDDKKDLELINRNAKRLLQLSDQLLSFSIIKSGNVKLNISNHNLINLIQQFENNFNSLAKTKQISFNINYDCNTLQNIWLDKDVLEKIINNLLSNAIKYTPKKGYIKGSIAIKNGIFQFSIINNTEAQSIQNIDKIFVKFYQQNPNQPGVGIGLSYVKELVNLHKGSISVKQPKPYEICFQAKLPIKKTDYSKKQLKQHLQKVKRKINQDSQIKILTQKQIKKLPHILIVEDNADVLNYLSDLFKEYYIVHIAADGQQGINKAMQLIPDIILSDIMMPIKSGIDLCEILKENEKTYHIPIILITAKIGEQNKFIGIKSGADDYIEKPFNNDLLLLKVHTQLENIKKIQSRFRKNEILKPASVSLNTTEEIFLNKIKNIIDINITHTTFNALQFSEQIGMSRMQLHRKIKAIFGVSTSEFIRVQRLKLATQLLKESTHDIAQIGYAVGFNTPSYFTKCFKQIYDCTPTQYALKYASKT